MLVFVDLCLVSWLVRLWYFWIDMFSILGFFFLIFFGVGCFCCLGLRLRVGIRYNIFFDLEVYCGVYVCFFNYYIFKFL